MAKYKVSIDTIPDESDLRVLLEDVQECLDVYDGSNTLLYDHLENSIARVLELPLPHPELEV